MKYLSLISLALLLSCSASKKEISLICIGDSITQGKVTGDSITEMSYRFRLWEMLDSAGYKVEMTGSNPYWFRESKSRPVKTPVSAISGKEFDRDHESFYGITSSRFLEGGFVHDSTLYPPFEERIRDLSPDIALIHLGSNDKQADSAISASNLEKIIDILCGGNPGMTIILAKTTTPWKSFINHSIEAIVKQARENHPEATINWTDMAAGWINRPDFPGSMTFDWAHPNEPGQEQMARNWFRAIKYAKDHTPPVFRNEIKKEFVNDSTLRITWNEATDNAGIAGYSLEVNGVQANWRYSEGSPEDRQCLALIPGTVYHLKNVSRDQEYQIVVKAWDYAGNSN